MFSYEICEIFKNTYVEEKLQKTASIFLFVLPQNTTEVFVLDEISTVCKVSIFLKRNNLIQSNAVIQFICKLICNILIKFLTLHTF